MRHNLPRPSLTCVVSAPADPLPAYSGGGPTRSGLASALFLFVVGDTGIEPVTSSVSGKRATAAPIAQVVTPGGGDGIRTRVDGFAGRCLSSRPLHHSQEMTARLTLPTRADDEIRTRDPNLGKVVRYHCATSAFDAHFCVPSDSSLALRLKTILARCVTKHDAQRVARLTGRQFRRGRLAQLVARFLHTEEVISSSLVSPTLFPAAS